MHQEFEGRGGVGGLSSEMSSEPAGTWRTWWSRCSGWPIPRAGSWSRGSVRSSVGAVDRNISRSLSSQLPQCSQTSSLVSGFPKSERTRQKLRPSMVQPWKSHSVDSAIFFLSRLSQALKGTWHRSYHLMGGMPKNLGTFKNQHRKEVSRLYIINPTGIE